MIKKIVLCMTVFVFVFTTASVVSIDTASAHGNDKNKSYKNISKNKGNAYGLNKGNGNRGIGNVVSTIARSRGNSSDALQAYIDRLLELIALLEAIRDARGDLGDQDNRSDVDVVTRSAQDIDEDSATLRGLIDLNGEDEATVFFKYGTSRSNLNKQTDEIDLDEDDDDEIFKETVTGLEEDTRYYFRAVAEDADGDTDRGDILTFVTDEDGSNQEEDPDPDTDEAEDVTEDSAELRGSVDMNDFNNGRVFFVYGEDKNQVEDVADDHNEYGDIDEDGESLQKGVVDNDLDSSDEYQLDIDGLDSETEIFFSICVEYEDEDDDLTILCGVVESFTTDVE